MKRNIAFLLALLLLFVLPGCKSGGVESPPEPRPSAEVETGADSEPLRVLVDVEFASVYGDPHVSTAFSSLKTNLKLCDADIGEVEFEYLPPKGEERAAALTHMQTEIMTGKGPDLFICACSRPWQEEKALFQFPTQVMDRKLFLPLDDYIAKAELTDFDRLAPLLMEQGRNEEGQQIVPLAFTMPMTVFRKSEVQHEHSRTMTRSDMLSGEDYLRASATVHGASVFGTTAYFKEVADYEKEELSFSEEELRDYLMEEYETTYSDDRPEPPDNFNCDLSVGFIDSTRSETRYMDEDHHGGLRKTDEFTMVPVYSKDGGYVAYITSLAAISRNTKKPREAFAVLDYLLSENGARSELYAYMTFLVGMPVNMDIGTEEKPIVDSGGDPWCLSDENFREYCSLRDNASAARFSTPLEDGIMGASLDIDRSEYERSQGKSAKEPEKIISDAYRVMEMELAES